MSYVVTGGLGYIGSHVIVEMSHYYQECNIVIIDNCCNSDPSTYDTLLELIHPKTSLSFIMDDVTTIDEDLGDFYLLHFAGLKSIPESFSNPAKYISNVEGLLHLLNRYHPKGVIFSSSASIYGTENEIPISEKAKLDLTKMSPYARTKYMSEQILSLYSYPSIALRYFNPIGIHSSKKLKELSSGNLIPALIDGKRKGSFTLYGGGTGIRDFIDVCDLAKAHILALERCKKIETFEVYNVGTGIGHSVNEVISIFKDIFGELTIIDGGNRIGDARYVVADNSAFTQVFNWVPSRSLRQSLSSLT